MASSRCRLPYKTPIPVGPIILWPLKAKKVGVQRLHVNGHVGDALRAIHQHQRASGVRLPGDFRHRVDRAQDIGYMGERHQPDPAFIQHPGEGVHVERAVLTQRHITNRKSLFGGQHLPGHDIRVVFHDGRQHDIAGLQVGTAPGLRDQIDAFGGAACENNLAFAGGVDKAFDFDTRPFIGGGGFFAEGVNTPVYVSVVAAVVVVQPFNDLERLLAGCGVIQVNQRHAGAGLLVQNGKICPDRFDVIWQGALGKVCHDDFPLPFYRRLFER